MSRVWSTTPRTSSFGSRKPLSTRTVPKRFPGCEGPPRVLHLAQRDRAAAQQPRPQPVVGVRRGGEDEVAVLDRDPDPLVAPLEPQHAGPALPAQLLDEVGDVLLVELALALHRRPPRAAALLDERGREERHEDLVVAGQAVAAPAARHRPLDHVRDRAGRTGGSRGWRWRSPRRGGRGCGRASPPSGTPRAAPPPSPRSGRRRRRRAARPRRRRAGSRGGWRGRAPPGRRPGARGRCRCRSRRGPSPAGRAARPRRAGSRRGGGRAAGASRGSGPPRRRGRARRGRPRRSPGSPPRPSRAPCRRRPCPRPASTSSEVCPATASSKSWTIPAPLSAIAGDEAALHEVDHDRARAPP